MSDGPFAGLHLCGWEAAIWQGQDVNLDACCTLHKFDALRGHLCATRRGGGVSVYVNDEGRTST